MKLALVMILLATSAAIAGGQSDSIRSVPDSGAISISDTVRVWSHQLKFKAKRGVVSRAPADSLAFTAPAGFRKIPREYVGHLATIERIDVLEGRQRSLARAGGKMLFGGAIGAVGGTIIGAGLASLFCDIGDCRRVMDDGDIVDERALVRFYAMIVFGTAGAAGGSLGGLVDGARSYERWRRVR